jgi:hypothetical protein
MGFSAMLADEYILNFPFAYHMWSGLDEQSQATVHILNYINFTPLRLRLTNHKNSEQQKAHTVSINGNTVQAQTNDDNQNMLFIGTYYAHTICV